MPTASCNHNSNLTCRGRGEYCVATKRIGYGQMRVKKRHVGRLAGTVEVPQEQKCSLDQFVGEREQSWRYRESKRFCGLEVDGELKLGRLLDGQLGRLGALQDAASVDAELTIRVLEAGAVTHQATRVDKLAPFVDR